MPKKEETSPFTWIVAVIFLCLSFYITYTSLGGGTPFESKSAKCKTAAQEKAKKLLRAKLAILKDKETPTQEDKNTIEAYESWIKHDVYSREDYNQAYTDCMR